MVKVNRRLHRIESRLWSSRGLAQGYTHALTARIAQLEHGYQPDQVPALLRAARSALEQAPDESSWETTFQVELMLVGLYESPALNVEIQRVLTLGESILDDHLRDWYEHFDWRKADLETRRTFLSRLTSDLQRALAEREMVRLYREDLTAQMSRRFIMTSCLFGLFLVGVLTLHSHLFSADLREDVALRHVVSVTSSFVGGLWGALFSMITDVRNRLDGSTVEQLLLQYRWLPARILAGAGSGLLVYLLFASQMLGGDLFPDFQGYMRSSEHDVGAGLQLYAKQLLWSVLAGFSERLIPDVLGRLESDIRTTRQDAGGPGRDGNAADKVD
jgi:hypothetical protein